MRPPCSRSCRGSRAGPGRRRWRASSATRSAGSPSAARRPARIAMTRPRVPTAPIVAARAPTRSLPGRRSAACFDIACDPPASRGRPTGPSVATPGRLGRDCTELRRAPLHRGRSWPVAFVVVSTTPARVYAARLVGLPIFDPQGDQVGKVRDLVVAVRSEVQQPRVLGLVAEVFGRRRIFVPMTRVTNIDSGQVYTTGLLNMRRFEQRPDRDAGDRADARQAPSSSRAPA